MSYEPIQTQSIQSTEQLTIPDLTVEPLENVEPETTRSRFGKIIDTNYTSPDPEFDTDERVITEQSTKVEADLSGNLTNSDRGSSNKSAMKTRKTRRYHYVKQGKKCKKVIRQYKKLKCKGKRSKKCRTLQKKRKTCKKIIKHKKAMARRSRKTAKNN